MELMEAYKALGIEPAKKPNLHFREYRKQDYDGRLPKGYTGADLLGVLHEERMGNDYVTFRDIFRNFSPSPRGKAEDMELRHAMAILAEADLIYYTKRQHGPGRPLVCWHLSVIGNNAMRAIWSDAVDTLSESVRMALTRASS